MSYQVQNKKTHISCAVNCRRRIKPGDNASNCGQTIVWSSFLSVPISYNCMSMYVWRQACYWSLRPFSKTGSRLSWQTEKDALCLFWYNLNRIPRVGFIHIWNLLTSNQSDDEVQWKKQYSDTSSHKMPSCFWSSTHEPIWFYSAAVVRLGQSH